MNLIKIEECVFDDDSHAVANTVFKKVDFLFVWLDGWDYFDGLTENQKFLSHLIERVLVFDLCVVTDFFEQSNLI